MHNHELVPVVVLALGRHDAAGIQTNRRRAGMEHTSRGKHTLTQTHADGNAAQERHTQK
jgi:hypothetical protein